MWTRMLRLAIALLVGVAAGGCARTQAGAARSSAATGLRGHLLLIGGGLDDDNRPVYERLIELARQAAGDRPPRVLIATAASGDQPANITGKTESIRAYCPACEIDSITRETPADETVARVDAADAMFFTGGDQKRITDRYLTSDGTDTAEATAMRRLLMRGGVIAGTSAGDAMMSDPMFLGGRSAEALGIRSMRRGSDEDGEDANDVRPLGPRIGRGMGFLPWAITDSHFFERHRFGRLVAALETSGKRLGIGVGEDACVEVDLGKGVLRGISVADSLLVDAGGLQRDGLMRRGVRTRVIRQGMEVSMLDLIAARPVRGAPGDKIPETLNEVAMVEPGQNRQLASWRFFSRGERDGAGVRLKLDGYEQVAWPAGDGWAVVAVGVGSEK